MGEEVRFKIQEYEQAIVRILDTDGAIGTGFLVAPGYVLTCAHVVVKAIYGRSTELCDYPNQPTEKIRLNFPVLDPSQTLEAQVVAWLSYHAEYGDVAGLKVLGTIPPKIKPIPIHVINPEYLSPTEGYLSYNFVESGGVKSSPYSYVGPSTDRRLRFKILQDINEEDIREGFSGAPLWNDKRGMVIGMLAMAEEYSKQAIAITKEALDDASNPILQQLRAYSLDDLLQHYLIGLKDREGREIKGAIASALCYVNPNQDVNPNQGLNEENTRRKQIVSLCTLPPRGWEEVDLLTQFAVFLSLENISDTLLKQLKKWVGYWREDWAELLARANDEQKKCHHLSASSNPHFIIEVTPKEQSEGVRLSIWEWKSQKISAPLFKDEEILLEDLPVFLHNNLNYQDHILHIFVDRDWLHLDFSNESVDDYEGTLGSEYKIVMRLSLKNVPYRNRYYQRCEQKWQLLQDKLNHPAQKTFIRAECLNYEKNYSKLRKELKDAEMVILQNLEKAKIGHFFDFITQTTPLPIALWSRKIELCPLVETVLDCQVWEIPAQIHRMRGDALGEDDDCIGRHLTLLWEDPNILPPSIQYNSEAC